jgi:hypothetical protein
MCRRFSQGRSWRGFRWRWQSRCGLTVRIALIIGLVPAPFDDHFPNIFSTSSRDGLQCGPAMFPFSWFHHQSRLQANFAAQGAGTGSDRNKASRLTRSLLSLIMTSPGIR